MSRVLIVEDDPAILCGLRDNLEFESHQVLAATDGEAGYRMLREQAPDLVILDLMLPKLSGYDLCKRARGEGFNAPILVLTARSQEGDRVLGLDLGANNYVSKPFFLRELPARSAPFCATNANITRTRIASTANWRWRRRFSVNCSPRSCPRSPESITRVFVCRRAA